jgi:hypothetical protein
MTNYNYGNDLRRTKTDLSTMECFDLLGPKTRRVVNDARILWSTRHLFIDCALRMNLSDEDLAEYVRNHDRKTLARLEAEREAMAGVWSEPVRRSKAEGAAAEPGASPKRYGRARRPSATWIQEAASRAAARAVPRSDFARAT